MGRRPRRRPVGAAARAVRLHLNRLASEHDADRWEQLPLDEGELALAAIADWGPAEEWEDWADAADPTR